jgi:hypothetical protein
MKIPKLDLSKVQRDSEDDSDDSEGGGEENKTRGGKGSNKDVTY